MRCVGPMFRQTQMNSTANQKSRLSIGLHPRRILAVIDFDAGAQAVLDCALQYAEMHGASIFFLHVVERDSFLSGMDEVVLALNPEDEQRRPGSPC